MANIALDLDGTLVEKKWPEIGEWLPGAREGVRELLDAGHHCYLYSARLSAYHPSGDPKDPATLLAQRAAVRQLLDEAGLEEVDIYEGNKPFWHLLIDDRAMRFPGRRNSWKRIVPAILGRVGSERSRH